MSHNYFQDMNVAVFTSKYVLENNSPILLVYHNHDNTWEFYGCENLRESDYRVVSLSEILQKDETLYLLKYLELGFCANRINYENNWIVMKSE